MLMVRARNIYAGNDINRVFRGGLLLWHVRIALFAVKMHAGKKNKTTTMNFPDALRRCHSLFYWNIYERLTNSRPENQT